MKRRKRRPKYGRIVFSILLLAFFVYFAVQTVINVFFTEHQTHVVAVGTLHMEERYEVLVMRNEFLVNTELTGKITYFVNEGTFVTSGNHVAEIFNDGSLRPTEEASDRELDRKQIEFDYNLLEYEIEAIKTEILFNLRESQYMKIPPLKKDLILKLDRLDRLKTDNRFLANRAVSYAEQTVGQGVLLEGQKKPIYAPANGIITFQMDGFESIVNIDQLYNIHFEELMRMDFSSKSMVKDYIQPKDALFKIVDNATYYLVAIVSQDSVETYKNVQSLKVDINGNLLNGMVYDVFSESEHAVVVIQMHEIFPGFHKNRWVSANVILQDYRGLKIPTDAIINQSGQLGVYAIDSNRRLRLVPIKILGYDDEHAIVQSEQFYDASKGIVRSVRLGQEIIRQAYKYSEGDRID